MAGNYPDAPSWRMAWDRDGSTGFWISKAGVISEMTSGAKNALNSEHVAAQASQVGSGTLTYYVGIVFPEPRDIDGYWINANIGAISPQTGSVEVSADTTNGLDGTWTNVSSSLTILDTTNYIPPKPGFRTLIASTTQLSKRGIRMKHTTSTTAGNMYHFHVYGEPVPGANPNRLELWHPTLDEKLPPAYFDFGNTPRSSSEDRTFRVKNLSATQTAGATRVAMDVLTDTTPSVPAQHTLSHGGGSFLAQVTIGDLAPGAISTAVTIRRVTPSNAVLGLWAFRVFAESTAWA